MKINHEYVYEVLVRNWRISWWKSHKISDYLQISLYYDWKEVLHVPTQLSIEASKADLLSLSNQLIAELTIPDELDRSLIQQKINQGIAFTEL